MSPRRKIVIGTNSAESSVTIDDIVYVIDCGRAKIKMFDPQRNFATLKPEWISQGWHRSWNNLLSIDI